MNPSFLDDFPPATNHYKPPFIAENHGQCLFEAASQASWLRPSQSATAPLRGVPHRQCWSANITQNGLVELPLWRTEPATHWKSLKYLFFHFFIILVIIAFIIFFYHLFYHLHFFIICFIIFYHFFYHFFYYFLSFFFIIFHHFFFQWCKNFPRNGKLQFSSSFYHFFIIF